MTMVTPATDVPSSSLPSPGRAHHGLLLRLAFAGVCLVVAYLVVIPLVLLAISSLRPTGFPTDPGLTLDNYRSTYLSSSTYTLLGSTLVFAVGSSLLAVVVGTAVAWLVERTDLPLRGWVRSLALLPMGIPPMLLAISWVLVLSPRVGVVNQAIHQIPGLEDFSLNIYSMWGMIFVQGLSVTPTAFLVMAPAIRNLDPAVEEAARTSGAGPLRTISTILLPILRPALLAATTFVLIVGLVSFDVPGVLGLPAHVRVLSSEVFDKASPASGFPLYGEISALLSFFLLLMIVLAWIYYRQTNRSHRYVSIGGRGYRAKRGKLGRAKIPAVIFVWGYIVCSVIAPVGVLVWTSLLPYYSGVSAAAVRRLSFSNYSTIFSDATFTAAVKNTLVVSVVAATAVVVLAAVISWFVMRTQLRGRKVVDVLAFLPLAIPHVLIGLALTYVYLTFTAVPIYGTVWILVVAFVTTYISFGTRMLNSVLIQIDPALEEAARTSGATRIRAALKITTPLMRPALIIVWIWVAAHAMRELSAALMLQGTDNQVMATLLWSYWSGGHVPVASATGVLLISAVLALGVAWARLSRNDQN